MTIASPCVRNCCLDNDDYCLGCYRHLNEIIGWQEKPESEKREIIRLCHERKAMRRAASLFPPSE